MRVLGAKSFVSILGIVKFSEEVDQETAKLLDNENTITTPPHKHFVVLESIPLSQTVAISGQRGVFGIYDPSTLLELKNSVIHVCIHILSFFCFVNVFSVCQAKDKEFWKELTEQYEPANVARCRQNAQVELNSLIEKAKSEGKDANVSPPADATMQEAELEEAKSDDGISFLQNDPFEPAGNRNMVSILFEIPFEVIHRKVRKTCSWVVTLNFQQNKVAKVDDFFFDRYHWMIF